MEAWKQALAAKGSIVFSVKVRPQASKSEFKGALEDGTLKFDLCAVPEEGEANEELIRFLAEEFGVPKKQIEILSGQTSRKKKVKISIIS